MPVGVLAAVGGRVVAVLVQFLVQQEFKVPALVVGRNLIPVHAAEREDKTITKQLLDSSHHQRQYSMRKYCMHLKTKYEGMMPAIIRSRDERICQCYESPSKRLKSHMH